MTCPSSTLCFWAGRMNGKPPRVWRTKQFPPSRDSRANPHSPPAANTTIACLNCRYNHIGKVFQALNGAWKQMDRRAFIIRHAARKRPFARVVRGPESTDRRGVFDGVRTGEVFLNHVPTGSPISSPSAWNVVESQLLTLPAFCWQSVPIPAAELRKALSGRSRRHVERASDPVIMVRLSRHRTPICQPYFH